ncbi:hypothetical protein CEY16_01545 [Halalkalibacillus sediminis]|uniref:Uncharacterized protein n=1 Tax=Halalkalibacillus sediminis TaxID=2018042 RepID=A0A2I0QVY0_9BACI|nr:hypothetical protein [Halalkalibacillus sediminis]PKR78468.1 hypothetical protein CEY16_01545 [Halalkalibacillus sediminis]
MLKTLAFIGDKLNDKNITWGVGGSLLLSFYEIIDNPNDIDILVDERDAPKVNEIISSAGKKKEALSTAPFRTLYFSKFRLFDNDIDVMGGFAIQHEKGIYKIRMQKESIVDYKKINGIEVPLCSLEDWYILYWLIPNKKEKALLIERYLKTNGVENPELLRKGMEQSLPLIVKERIEKLIS